VLVAISTGMLSISFRFKIAQFFKIRRQGIADPGGSAI
jgi:hypothetical protein